MNVSNWNFADVWEAIASLQPDLPALVRGESVTSWQEFERRSEGLASVLLAAGLARQTSVACYLHNSAEYMETLFACFKASLVPVNTNYRYVSDELRYLWTDADVEAVVFHGAFSDRIEELRGSVPSILLWLWVDDGSGTCPNWAVPYEAAISAAPAKSPNERSGDDLFMLYTGGTTGQPKGVMWRQDDLFAVLNRTAAVRYPEEGSVDDVAAVLPSIDEPRGSVVPAAPLMHGTAAFSAFGMLGTGGVVVLCEGTRFDVVELLDTISRHKVSDLSIVGDAFARPMLDALDAEPDRWDVSALRVILSSGVMWSAPVKQGLIRHMPDALCVDTLGSSEAVGLARSISSSKKTASTAGFKLGPDAQVIRDDGSPVEPGSGEVGLVAIGGRGPIGYRGDAEKTARTFRVIGDRRWITPGDNATVDADGTIHLLGRGSSCINTGGEKVFPEEVEEALKLDPTVADAVVVGVPHDRFGEMVVAVVAAAPESQPTESSLLISLRSSLAAYKVPRHFFVVDSLGRGPNGKIDQRRWKAEAAERVASLAAVHDGV
jgi:acyl-CoA synthetase (AMP-forming)/AMP-acid ligase II